MTPAARRKLIEQLYEDAAQGTAEAALKEPFLLARGEVMARNALQSFQAAQRALLEQSERRRLEVRPNPMRPSIVAMSRSALLAHLEHLAATIGGRLVLQHRDLASMPDEDLRSLIIDIEAVSPRSNDEPSE